MPVSETAWSRGMLELALLPSREESPELESLRGEVYRREIQPELTDHQWRFAVGEAVRMCEWFPPVVRLLEFGAAAPVQEVRRLPAPECELCEGTGFEPFMRGGNAWVQFCPRGCKPHNAKLDGPKHGRPDYRTEDERREDNAKGLALCLEELQKRGMDLKAKTMPEEG